jgi:hypothetical protein
VDLTSSLAVPRPAPDVFAAVEDLGGYPDWLTIVARAEPAPADGGDAGPAWLIELRGRLGPLARSKRLRMVRTVHDEPGRLRFERRELDGRNHSAWVLDAVIVADADDTATLTMGLHYGGSFGGSLLERMLRQEVEQSKPRLLALLSTPA